MNGMGEEEVEASFFVGVDERRKKDRLDLLYTLMMVFSVTFVTAIMQLTARI